MSLVLSPGYGLRTMAVAQRPQAIRGRSSESGTLDRLIEDARGSRSGVLVVRGEPGIGKSSLLRYAADKATGFRVARITGVEAEMELPFAALHQLFTPLLDRLEALPEPQQDALRVALGVAPGAAPDRFLVGLATLSLLAEVAEDQPLLCLVDDLQWLDDASAQVLGFVARRLLAEPIAIVFTVRAPADPPAVSGLPELWVRGLGHEDARALLATVVPGRLDERVRERLIAETGGNPLALLELPRGMSAAELAGGFGMHAPLEGIEDAFQRLRLEPLPDDTRRLLQLVAADPVGEPLLLWRAAAELGLDPGVADTAVDAGLLDMGAQVRFRHPCMRTAAYRTAAPEERHEIHAALARVTDPELDPDRRAWHLAQAAASPPPRCSTRRRCSRRTRAAGRAACSPRHVRSATPARSTRRWTC